jgi:hypothetical protein
LFWGEGEREKNADRAAATGAKQLWGKRDELSKCRSVFQLLIEKLRAKEVVVGKYKGNGWICCAVATTEMYVS